ncbi:MAG: amidohydrolase [Halioglobus sp.]
MTYSGKWKSILVILFAILLPPHSSAEPVDWVIKNARIWTGNPDSPWATAMVGKGEKILAVGDDTSISKYLLPDTRIFRESGELIVPGFIDSHVHLMPSGFELSQVQLRDATTPAEFSGRIKSFSGSLPANEWILGGTWDHQNWGGELPHRDWIDAVTPYHPVMVVRLDGHMALANSIALQLAGIDESTADVAGGEIVRDADGRPTGVLKDNAMELVSRVIPKPSPSAEDAALQSAMAYLAANGVTTVHDMSYDWQGLFAYRRAREQASMSVRIHANVPIADWKRLAHHVDTNGFGDHWLVVGGVKGFMDGSLGSHTAAMYKPFSDTPDDSGFMITPVETMRELAIAADAAGLRLNIHAIGTLANAEILNIFQAVRKVNGDRGQRFRIEHAQHLRPQEIARIGEENIIPSMQPFHTIDDGRWAESVIGPERARYTYAFKSILDAGARLVFGSDWSVAPADPLYGIYAAVSRETLDGDHPGGWVPEEKITVEQAMVAYTRDAAYAGYDEGDRGMLAPGLLADFVVLDTDIFDATPEEIRDASVLQTVVGGRTVYKAQ